MKKFLKITLWSLNFLVILFLLVFSQIQIGYAEKEKERAIMAQRFADENAMAAQEQAVRAEKVMADAASQMELLKSELEACKSKK